MVRLQSLLLAIILFFFIDGEAQQQQMSNMEWSVITQLPVAKGETQQLGLAGVTAGIHNNVMLVAGGANFPGGLPWKGAQKVYYDDVYVMQRTATGEYQWHPETYKLPFTTGYGASVTAAQGVVCIGGENEKGISSRAYLMQWNGKEVVIQPLPDLPVPLSNAAAAIIGNTVYVAGGETTGGASNGFYSLDLSVASARWQSLPLLPQALSYAVGVAQSNGEYNCIYIIGGRAKTDSGISRLFNTVWMYDPKKNNWTSLQPIAGKGGIIPSLSASTGIANGTNYILVFSGDRGEVFLQIEQYNRQIAAAASPEEKEKLQQAKEQLLNSHAGFSKDIFLFNTITNAWTSIGELPLAPVTTTAVRWGNDILIPGGEIKPGIRTPQVLKGSLSRKEYFSVIDYTVLILYLLLMVGIGVWSSRHQSSTNDYFRGGQRIPGWAAGLSIYGTQLSAITFMSIPAKTYASNWNYFFFQMTILMIVPVIARYFIPFYRKLQITSAYEYLEKRFNYAARALASLLYIMLQIGRLAIVLLLPSLALTLVTGIDVSLCILMMGIITIFYTMKGGITAVIWTDVAQVIILLGGALVCLAMMFFQIDMSIGDMWQTLQDNRKLDIVNTVFSVSEPTLWVVLVGGLAINLITYGGDQSVVQKYLTTRNEAASRRSLRLGAWMALPSTLIFFSIGTLLYLFFKTHPEKVNYQLQSQDAIFPWYIVRELPAGVTGLLIAAVFAAAMSTLSSSMNSVTTALITDFYRRFIPDKEESSYLRSARWITLIIGVIGTSLALVMARWGISSLWDQFNTILGLFTGGLGGLFVLGIFTRRVHASGAVAGLLISGGIQYYISRYTNINLLLYAFTGLVSCIVFGYLFSLLLPGKQKDIAGLTVYDMKRK